MALCLSKNDSGIDPFHASRGGKVEITKTENLKPNRWRRGIAWIALILCVAAFILLAFPERFLRAAHTPVQSDAIVVLGGEQIKRTRAAASLLTNGFAPRVILSGIGDCEENSRLLKQFGVWTNIIELECQSTSTQENALFTVKLFREHKCKRVIIVTSWYHSRRALSCFRKYAPEIEFISVPAPRTRPWKDERNDIAAEYAKMIFYGVRYGIFPWNT